MKNLFILIILSVITVSCIENKEKNFLEIPTYLFQVKLNEEINTFISDFIGTIEREYFLVELYIDKRAEDIYYLTIFDTPSVADYMTNYYPLSYTVINDRYIFIYTGLEDFINDKSYHSKLELPEMHKKNMYFKSTNTLVIIKDTSYIAGEFGWPFTDWVIGPPI